MPADRVATDMVSLLDIEELDTNLYRGSNEQRAAVRADGFADGLLERGAGLV